jgi:hypothetical protein
MISALFFRYLLHDQILLDLFLVAIFLNTDSGFRFVFGGDISGVLALECHLSGLCVHCL